MLKCLIRKKPSLPIITSTYDQIKREYTAAKIIQKYFRKRLRICSICCDNFIQCKYRVILDCNHTFHFSCYNKLYTHNHIYCPDCRKIIKSLLYKSKPLTLREVLEDTYFVRSRRETLIGIGI